MDLTHEFTVPLGIDRTWEHFTDIGSVAQCFPGAQVTSAEGDTFQGSCKVKLGPIALVYNGSGRFVELDESAHRMLIEAKGKDKRGNGTAGATVTVTMTAAGDSSTAITVVTDLSITGKPAQFGRGVMQDVSDKLLGQFVSCLEQRFADTGEAADEVQDGTAGGSGDGAEEAAEPSAGSAPSTAGSGAAGGDDAPAAAPVGGAGSTAARNGTPSATPPRSTPPPPPPRAADDSLDLGSAVLPVLARSYGKQAAGVLGALALLVWFLRRR